MFDIKEELKKLPDNPGVYLMKDEFDKIIYIGKAVNLKNRVRQYFQKATQNNAKVLSMVPNIKEFEYIITDTELEALILECNLIKLHAPKYNVVLKDDKSYPFIKITTNENYPRVIFTRKHKKDKGRYFGPYTGAYNLKELIEVIHKIWPLRDCRRIFPRDIGKERPCLNLHIGKCIGPCTGNVSIEQYDKMIEQVIKFLNGKHNEILKDLKSKMENCANNLEFEKAAEYRDKINIINRLNDEQKLEGNPGDVQDVIGFARAFNEALVQVFFIRGGKMTGREHFMLNGVENMTREEVMTGFIKQYYSETTFIPKELILETEINDKEVILDWLRSVREQNIFITVPQKGEKLRLVQLASKNAIVTLEQFGEQMKREKQRTIGATEQIKNVLLIDNTLERIEAFDISNIQGYEPVGSMVVFENGKPKRSDYRKFKIKGVFGPNDYASIEEVLNRRFERYKKELIMQQNSSLKSENKFIKLPDIIFIDGGKGQVSIALKVLNKMNLNIPVCGMVKDDRHRTRGLLYDNKEISLPFTSEGFKLVTRIQDEVHRFAIEYHRKLRGKTAIRSILDDIHGIGRTRRKELLRHFGDINNIRNATIEQLLNVECMDKRASQAVYNFFRQK